MAYVEPGRLDCKPSHNVQLEWEKICTLSTAPTVDKLLQKLFIQLNHLFEIK